MKILVTGASGLIGKRLCQALEKNGHEVKKLTRYPKTKNDVFWNYEKEEFELTQLLGLEGVIHLAGENISKGRWTRTKKQRIYESRVKGTNFLVETLIRSQHLPKVFLSASAIGYYGNRSEEELDESSSPGRNFVAKVCKDWEAASKALEERGVRCIQARLGMVLAPEGGALKKMIPAFKLGLGGRLGSGQQWISWIDIEDLISSLLFLFNSPHSQGAYNLCAPTPLRQKDFARLLANHLKQPHFLSAPRFILRLLMGEMADDLLLASTKVMPKRLLEEGYQFQYSDLSRSLDHLLD